tara:strand:+ start:163 stop:714 length:552 start_codon:yes stop_codon:yes gene_type:complete
MQTMYNILVGLIVVFVVFRICNPVRSHETTPHIDGQPRGSKSKVTYNRSYEIKMSSNTDEYPNNAWITRHFAFDTTYYMDGDEEPSHPFTKRPNLTLQLYDYVTNDHRRQKYIDFKFLMKHNKMIGEFNLDDGKDILHIDRASNKHNPVHIHITNIDSRGFDFKIYKDNRDIAYIINIIATES